jgi:hypothetical protein
MYYGRSVNSTIINSLINTGLPSGQIVASVASKLERRAHLPNILATAPAGTASVQYYAKDYQNPLIHQGDVVFVREVGTQHRGLGIVPVQLWQVPAELRRR